MRAASPYLFAIVTSPGAQGSILQGSFQAFQGSDNDPMECLAALRRCCKLIDHGGYDTIAA